MNIPNPEKILQDSLIKIKELKRELETVKHGEIAIIGMNCHFPGGANNTTQFWQLLAKGYDASSELGTARWNHANYHTKDQHQKGKIYTDRAGLLDTPIESFDAAFFGINSEEAILLDPQQRILLETTWEALENAGINPIQLRDSLTGVFIGISSSDYKDAIVSQAIPESTSGYVVTGNIASTAAGRIAYVFDLKGPTLSLDTACSSSLAAVHQACQALRLGECELAIAGGVHIILSPQAMALECSMQMLSLQGACKTFDEQADGFMRSEGCGMIVLKELKKAILDGDSILAVIKGSAINHGGAGGGLTIPNGAAQEDVITRALQQAKLLPDDIDYIEAQGTGTRIGDSIEIKALYNVFGADKGKNKRTRPLTIGTVKTNIGHTEAVSGIAGLIKTVLSLQNEEIPKFLHFESLNSSIKDFEKIPARLPLQTIPWKKEENHKRRAGVSAFAFNGTNVHMILEEYINQSNYSIPAEIEAETNEITHVLIISAKTIEALQQQIDNYLNYLKRSNERIEDICYTSQDGRAQLDKCILVKGKSKAELIANLESKSYLSKEQAAVLDYKYSKEIRKYLKKVLLPTYPFQRSIYWPKNLYLPKNNTQLPSESNFSAELLAISKENRKSYLHARILAEVKLALNMTNDLDENLGFFDMGMSSLMALEFKERLELLLAKKVEDTAVFEYSTLAKLTDYCQELLSDSVEFISIPTNDDPTTISSQDSTVENIYNMTKEDLYASLYSELSNNKEK